MTQAVAYTALGGPEVLTVIDIDKPVPAPGEVAVQIEAAGVNPIDLKLRSGLRPSPPIVAPRRLGSDASGIVTAIGDGVEGFRPGDPVVLFGHNGMYASDVVLPAQNVQPRPLEVSAARGAAIGIPAGTAYQSLRSLCVGAKDTLLVHGGSGAVGQAAIQFATLWGARVIATASPARFERVEMLGTTAVAYGDGLRDRVHEAARGGISVVLDAAGTDEALAVSMQLGVDSSRIATLVRGADAARLGIRAFSGGSPHPLTPAQQHWRAEAVPVTLALMAAGLFDVELADSFSLDEACDAHRAVHDGVHGKVIITP